MWARTSSNYIRAQGLRLGAIHTSARTQTSGKHVQRELANAKPPKTLSEPWLRSNKFYIAAQGPSFSSMGTRCLSLQAGVNSGGEEEDELDDGFSELEVTEGSQEGENSQSDDESELSSEAGLLDENDAVQSSESELKLATENELKTKKKEAFSNLTWLLLKESKSIVTVLDKYVSEGKTVEDPELSHAMLTLRRRKLFRKALQFSEWLEVKKVVDFTERNYATRLDLIAKVHGVNSAERYIQKIPESFRGEVIYRTLIANCIQTDNQKKAEDIFNNMKKLNFATSAFACNQMIILYKKIDKKKIADVLLYMEKENIKPTQTTYRLLIDTKGMLNDISGMDEIVETMKSDGIEPDVTTKAILAKHYINSGLKERAESILKEIEGNDSEKRAMCSELITLYASLGKEDEVERIWKICEPNPQFYEYLAVINAWGKLKQIAKAEASFEKLENQKKLTSRHYTTMLRVYANNKMLNKGTDLVKRMGESGCRLGPMTWDALVKLYAEAGKVEKADDILHKATQQNNKQKPLFTSYMTIMEHYARKGDVHNAEKILHRLKLAGYTTGRIRPFQVLLQAYIKSRTPAYGLRERVMADNIIPNRALTFQLAEADPFKKTAVSDLLD